jgi:hypothetical protein
MTHNAIATNSTHLVKGLHDVVPHGDGYRAAIGVAIPAVGEAS